MNATTVKATGRRSNKATMAGRTETTMRVGAGTGGVRRRSSLRMTFLVNIWMAQRPSDLGVLPGSMGTDIRHWGGGCSYSPTRERRHMLVRGRS